jgi:uncharacterized membrane protein YcaP (DUF421 family)
MSKLFEFQVSPWELMVRGTLIYWFLFVLFRFLLRRDSGSVGLADILVIVLIADAAQNGMAGEYKSVGEGMVLIGTIVGWNYFIDWMSFRYGWFARFASPRTVLLVENGRLLRKNLEREMITEDELNSQLRQSGIDELITVKRAQLEPDGHISVIKSSQTTLQRKRAGQPGAA